jgi:rod shape-determining protein MreB
MSLFDMFTQEIAIDLGTANTLIIHNNKIVIDQPSIVAIERSTVSRLLWENRQNICRENSRGYQNNPSVERWGYCRFHASEHMIKEFIKKFLELKVNSFSLH